MLICCALVFFPSCAVKPKVTVIRLGSFAGSAWRVPNIDTYVLYDEAIALFEKEHPEIKIEYKSGILRDDYSEWLASKILRQEEPDFFFILPEDFHLFADIGILYPLDSFLRESAPIQACDFFVSAMQAGKQNNIQFAIPIENDPTLLFVNTTLLEREGIPFPESTWTWDDFFTICRKVTRDRDGNGYLDQFGVKGFNWTMALYTNRAQLFSYGGTKGLFDSDEVNQSFTFLSNLDALSKGQKIPDFDSGAVAFNVSSYSWYRAYGYYPYSILKNRTFKWKATVLPRGPSGKNAADLKTLFMGISSRSAHKKEAMLFLEFFLTNEKIQTLYFEKSKGIPVRKDLVETDIVKNILLKDITLAGNEISTETIVKSINDAFIVPDFRRYQTAVSFIDKEITPIPGDSSQLKNYLSQLNIKINAYLAK